MKKLVCIFLALIMCTFLLVACGKDDPAESKDPGTASQSPTESSATQGASSEAEDSSAAEQVSQDPYRDEEGIYVYNKPLQTFDGREFSIIVRGVGAGTYQSDDFTTGSELYGELLDNAVTERNRRIEDKYQVKLKIYKSETVGSDPILDNIREDVSSGKHLYDAIMPSIPVLAALAQEGNLYDLSEYIDTEAPWWDANATSTFSIANKLFFTTGDITILNKVCSGGFLFNKGMIETLKLDNPYELVKNHEWTYDKMKEMAKAATQDTDGIDGMTCADTWGLLAAHNDALTLYGAAGFLLCDKDQDDMPYLSFGGEESVTVIQKIINDMLERNTWVIYAQDFEAPIWVTSLDAFINNQVLFRPSAFSATTKLRIAGADFGIVPNPLWSTEQDEYLTYCGTGETAGVAISLGCADPEYSAYMLDAIACESKNYITPAYVEINLKGKDAQDDESLEMLEIIFNNIVYDVGDVYNFGTIKSFFSTLVRDGKPDVVSEFKTIEGTITSKIEEVIDNYLS